MGKLEYSGACNELDRGRLLRLFKKFLPRPWREDIGRWILFLRKRYIIKSLTFKGYAIHRWLLDVIDQFENLERDSIVFLTDEVASITKEFMDSGSSLRRCSIPPSLASIDRLLFIPKWRDGVRRKARFGRPSR